MGNYKDIINIQRKPMHDLPSQERLISSTMTSQNINNAPVLWLVWEYVHDDGEMHDPQLPDHGIPVISSSSSSSNSSSSSGSSSSSSVGSSSSSSSSESSSSSSSSSSSGSSSSSSSSSSV